ncbi:hypothetical protein FTUN_1892 [Frigoriglobus tundricola]|uniref:Uncharacterized protein n=1 Tax=Frigoriglobus tundricola TaxID=2774151 RepID=A0A6M5YN46_9BACT|nr:hypothetical protein FTUN_1892 [Frigoriglobus tundricola]
MSWSFGHVENRTYAGTRHSCPAAHPAFKLGISVDRLTRAANHRIDHFTRSGVRNDNRAADLVDYLARIFVNIR